MTISFNKNGVLVKQEACVCEGRRYIIFIYISKTDQSMGGSMSWLGAQEKHQVLHQMFIKSLIKLGR